ncbi:MAG: hypothetical protein K0U66_01360 [Gammaproteobacteria bacterium]|nr:hypothetical protein [Pseudomonadota bacterium]MCH9662292.1 hypothetical protein [Gammaproteobacteria bacterium]
MSVRKDVAFIIRLLFLGLVAVLATMPTAQARGLSIDLSQRNLVASYGFSVGSSTSNAAVVDIGLLSDINKNAIYFARATVLGNISGTDEGWRIGGGGQLNYITLGRQQRAKIDITDPEPHSIDIVVVASYTISGKVPIVFGIDINYAPEILSFGRLENKFSHYTYVNFELLPAFTMRLGYQGHNLFFKNNSVARLNTRYFIGIDILF